MPHGGEDLLAGFTVSLLEKAANSGLLGDIRALFLAPRVVLALEERNMRPKREQDCGNESNSGLRYLNRLGETRSQIGAKHNRPLSMP